ncbi:MAG: hypothetical protein IIY43_08465 [Oscillospiraceae bacterium]|nr:hypothetical protein [Oscillospiraceae bacterium]
MPDNRQHENYGLWTWIGLAGLTLAAMLTAVCVGSVSISVRECLQVFRAALTGAKAADPGQLPFFCPSVCRGCSAWR